ncbi:ATP synthase subunit B [gut metagenome]|uniref:ATP synthase subunit B n=1 Tax=gut metagenome TaxID=749906 RepID=J9GJR9_9ZZZZ
MVLTCLALADTFIFQTTQRRQNVHRRNNALTEQFTAQDDLTLGDVAGKVGDGVSLIVLRHGQNGDHGDRTLLALTTACTLIHSSKVGVQVAGVTTTAWNFLLSCGDFTKSLSVVCNISEDNQNLHVLLECQILGSGQSHTRSSYTLNSRVICKVGENNGTVDSAGTAEVVDEVLRFFVSDTDSSKDNSEGLVITQNLSLSGYLSCESCVGQTGAGEYR